MGSGKLIWIVEDDPGAQFVYDEILGFRYQLQMFKTLKDLRQAFGKADVRPAAVIADIRLPDGSFLSFLASTEGITALATVPFLVVSSVDDIDALRYCFERGAADYLTKPFGKSELIFKLDKILRSHDERQPDTFSLDQTSFTVMRQTKQSPLLTSKEFQIMASFSQAPDHKITKDELIASVWGGLRVTPKTFDVHLFNLRRKLAPLDIEIRYLPPNTYYVCESNPSPTLGHPASP